MVEVKDILKDPPLPPPPPDSPFGEFAVDPETPESVGEKIVHQMMEYDIQFLRLFTPQELDGYIYKVTGMNTGEFAESLLQLRKDLRGEALKQMRDTLPAPNDVITIPQPHTIFSPSFESMYRKHILRFWHRIVTDQNPLARWKDHMTGEEDQVIRQFIEYSQQKPASLRAINVTQESLDAVYRKMNLISSLRSSDKIKFEEFTNNYFTESPQLGELSDVNIGVLCDAHVLSLITVPSNNQNSLVYALRLDQGNSGEPMCIVLTDQEANGSLTEFIFEHRYYVTQLFASALIEAQWRRVRKLSLKVTRMSQQLIEEKRA